MKIIGIDYSLTSPAVTVFNGNNIWSDSISDISFYCLANTERQRLKWSSRDLKNIEISVYKEWNTDLERYHFLADWVINSCITVKDPVRPKAYIEDYAFAAVGRVFHIAENMAILKDTLNNWGIEYETIPPTVIKKYATDKGNANKEKMYESFSQETQRNLKHEFDTKLNNPITDIVDSYYIAKYGHAHGNNT